MRGCSGGYETRLHCKTGCYSMLITGGPAKPLGYLRAETPLEENPQALPHRARPRR